MSAGIDQRQPSSWYCRCCNDADTQPRHPVLAYRHDSGYQQERANYLQRHIPHNSDFTKRIEYEGEDEQDCQKSRQTLVPRPESRMANGYVAHLKSSEISLSAGLG